MTQQPLGWLTWRDADGMMLEFLERLSRKEFATTCCNACGSCFLPPQSFCPDCFSGDVSWKELSGRARLYAFTQIDRSFRFPAPDVVGLVEVEGVDGKVFTRIDAPLEELEIGMDLEVGFVDIGGGHLLHQFSPVKTEGE